MRGFHGEQLRRLPCPHSHCLLLRAATEFRIEADILSRGAIEKLCICDVPCVGPYIGQEHRLTPSGVAIDDVGIVARFLQLHCGTRSVLSPSCLIGKMRGYSPVVVLEWLRLKAVVQCPHERRPSVALSCQGTHVVAQVPQCRNKVRELAREILMNEQNLLHGSPPQVRMKTYYFLPKRARRSTKETQLSHHEIDVISEMMLVST